MLRLQNYSLRAKIFALLSVVAVVYVVILTYFFYSTSIGSVEDNLRKEQTDNSMILNSLIEDYKTKALLIARVFANNSAVKEAYSNPDDKAGSDYLMASLKSTIDEVLKDKSVKDFQIHYHKAPAKSFLRTWTNKRFDDLTAFRPSIIQVADSKSAIKTIEFGVGGFALRGIAPIIIDGVYAGSVEFLFNLTDAVNLISNNITDRVSLNLIEKSIAQTILKPDELNKLYSTEFGNYLLSLNNNPKIPVAEIFSDILIEKIKNESGIISGNYQNYYYSLIPVIDCNDKPIGYLANIQDNSVLIEKQKGNIIIEVVIIGVLVFLFIGAIVFFIDVLILKPIRKVTFMANEISKGNIGQFTD
ncbi:hypothetical protein MASR1M45_01460 [Candidatus Kapaibacterium sp.]